MPPVAGREDRLPEIIDEIVATYDAISKTNHLGER